MLSSIQKSYFLKIKMIAGKNGERKLNLPVEASLDAYQSTWVMYFYPSKHFGFIIFKHYVHCATFS